MAIVNREMVIGQPPFIHNYSSLYAILIYCKCTCLLRVSPVIACQLVCMIVTSQAMKISLHTYIHTYIGNMTLYTSVEYQNDCNIIVKYILLQ